MKVLLLSPLPKIDPACGDVTYTETLLQHPPEGVQYETYADAIQRGALVERFVRPRFSAEPLRTLVAKGINICRAKRRLFWEPFRFFTVKSGEYDLIHLHVFATRFYDLDCPLVTSNALPLRFLYTDARAMSEQKVQRIEAVETALSRAWGINHLSYHQPQATRAIAFTSYLKDWYVQKGIVSAGRVDVVPIYLPSLPNAAARETPNNVGFIAKDFASKGGHTLLKAFEKVRHVRPASTLTIVGCAAEMDAKELERRNITWLPYVPRAELMSRLLPTMDVFAYPTVFDGQPLTVLEAMSMGIPVATSDYRAMPELVDHGRAGAISKVGDVEGLAVNILRLFEPRENQRMRAAARRYFEETYSSAAVRPQLRDCYERALAAKTNPIETSKPSDRVLSVAN